MTDVDAVRVKPMIGLVPLACVAVFGAALGAAWDLLHVTTGTSVYSIGAERMPLWVPLEFAVVYVVGVIGIALLGAPVPDVRSRRRVIGEAAWVTVVYAMTAFLHRWEWLVVVLAVAGLLARRRAISNVVRGNPLPAAALVVGGPLVEAILIAAGVFRYANASLGNIPLWLPLLYANAVVFAVRLAEAALSATRVAAPKAA